MSCGGFGDYKPIDETAKAMANVFKAEIEGKINEHKPFTVFEPTEFKTQVVRGTNYVIKIKVDGDKFIEAKIYKDLP